MHVGTGDIELDDAGQFLFIEQSGAFAVFLDGKAGDIRQHLSVIDLFQFRQDLFLHLMDAGILQPDRIQHAGRRFRDARQRIAVARMQGRSLDRETAGEIDIEEIQIVHSVSESAAGRDQRVLQFETREIYLKFCHTISSFVNTGPSLQMRALRSFSCSEQPMQAPKPQPILVSREHWPEA